ncbi:MAG TPA: MaoC family dehydratase [Acetobacteraceae bacterium]
MPHLHLEDLHVGQRFRSETAALTATDIRQFAAQWDPQPFHLDEAAARGSPFAGLVASSWHTAAISMRLLVAGGLPLAGGIIGTGGELLWLKPVRPGDTLLVETEILDIVPSRSRPDRGMVQVRCLTLNQDGETVQSFSPKLVVMRRPASQQPAR